MITINSLPLDPFYEEEVAEVVRSLKVNKAAGPDDIYLEHLHFGWLYLVAVLTLLQ